MKYRSFEDFVDSALVEIADNTPPDGKSQYDLNQIFDDLKTEFNETWFHQLQKHLRDEKYAQVIPYSGAIFIVPLHRGLLRADKVREARRPKSFREKLNSDTAQLYINYAGLFIALAALIVACVKE